MIASKAIVPCMRLSNAVMPKRFYAYKVPGPVHPGYIKIREQYKRFQVDDGVPVHLKGGMFDKVLYYTTLGGCGIGLIWTFAYIFESAFPPKKQ